MNFEKIKNDEEIVMNVTNTVEQIVLRKCNSEDEDFIYEVKKNAYKKYVEQCWGTWDEKKQREYFRDFINTYKNSCYIIQFEGKEIGIYQDDILENGVYRVGNICIIPEYQGKGIGTKILKNMLEKHSDQDITIQYFKQNPVGNLYQRLGFVLSRETTHHYQMIKKSKKK